MVVEGCCHYEGSILAAGVKAPSYQGDGFSAKATLPYSSIVTCKTQYTADETWSELELRKLLKCKLFHTRKIPESSTSVLSTEAVLLLPRFHDIQSTETGVQCTVQIA